MIKTFGNTKAFKTWFIYCYLQKTVALSIFADKYYSTTTSHLIIYLKASVLKGEFLIQPLLPTQSTALV